MLKSTLRFVLASAAIMSAQAYAGGACGARNLNLTPGATGGEININWLSDAGRGATPKARFTNPATGETDHEAGGCATEFGRGEQSNKVTVRGLRPGARYRYSVSADGSSWGAEHDFTAMPAGAFRFAVIADAQLTEGAQYADSAYFSSPPTTAAGWAETVGKIAEARADFILSLGDQVDDGPDADTAAEYALFFAPAPLRSIPVSPVMGNHDFRSRLYGHNFNLPNEMDARDPATGVELFARRANYFHLCNNVLFVALNTSVKPGEGEARELADLFGKTLQAARDAYAGRYDWLVVAHHKSTASVAEHFASRDIQAYADAGFERLMTEHGVDLVLAGHDHIYAVSKPLRWCAEHGHSVPAGDGAGTVYMTLTTASGLKYYTPFSPREENADYPPLVDGRGGVNANAMNPPLSNARFVQNRKPGYTIADVDGAAMTLTTYSVDGDIVDKFTLKPAFGK